MKWRFTASPGVVSILIMIFRKGRGIRGFVTNTINFKRKMEKKLEKQSKIRREKN